MLFCHSLLKKSLRMIRVINTERKVTPEVLISATINLTWGAMWQILCKHTSSVKFCITSY